MCFNPGPPTPTSLNKRLASTFFTISGTAGEASKFIVFGADSKLYKIGLDGTNKIEIRGSTSKNPMLSTDGTRVIFENPTTLRSMSPSGANEKTLSADYYPAVEKLWLSADGTQAVYFKNTNAAKDVHSRDTTTGALNQYGDSNCDWPSVSSDGNTYVWIQYGVISKKVGSVVSVIKDLDTSETVSYLCIAPDASAVVFSEGTNVKKLDLSTEKVTDLTTDTTNSCKYPLYSPDSSKIAYIRGNSIYVINAAGSLPSLVANSLAEDYSFSWTPDSSKIVYVKSTANKMAFDVVVNTVYVAPADGSKTSGTVVTGTPSATRVSASSMTRHKKKLTATTHKRQMDNPLLLYN